MIKTLKHLAKLEKIEDDTVDLLHTVSSSIAKTIKKARVKKLAKTEIKLKIDFLSLIEKIIEKHLDVLRHATVENSTSTQANTKDLKMTGLVTPASVVQSYLEQLKFHENSEHASEKANTASTKALAEHVAQKSGEHIDQSLLKYKNALKRSIESKISEFEVQKQADAQALMEMALKSTENDIAQIEKKKQIVNQQIKKVLSKEIPMTQLKQAIRNATNDYASDWTKIIQQEMSNAQAIADKHAIEEVFADKAQAVHFVTAHDDNVTEECDKWSYNDNGDPIYYNPKTLLAAGYNFDKKRKDWKPSYAPRHFGCRCVCVIVPVGFKCDSQGSLVKLEKGERIELA